MNAKISKVEGKIPDTSSFVAITVLNTNNCKYITTQKFNKLMPENFAARLKQADLVKKTNFDNKLTRFKNKLLQIKQNIQKLKKKIKKKNK